VARPSDGLAPGDRASAADPRRDHQLPPGDELVLVSGFPPIRARKARYYQDKRLISRVLDPPALTAADAGTSGDRPVMRADDWTALPIRTPPAAAASKSATGSSTNQDPANGGIRQEPGPRTPDALVSEPEKLTPEMALLDNATGGAVAGPNSIEQTFLNTARQAALDPDDGVEL
jgi:type IV secretion system protein VirD4